MDNGAQWSLMQNHMHLLCSRVPKTATCLQVGPMSLEWPVDPFARFDLSRPSPFPEDPNNDQKRGDLPASTRSRWRQNALQAPHQVLQRNTGWDGHGPFLADGLRCITWNTRGLIGSVFSEQKNTEFKLKYLKKLICQQQHFMSPGGAWKGRISSGNSGVGSAVSVIWYLLS